jgi:hypothetical protein
MCVHTGGQPPTGKSLAGMRGDYLLILQLQKNFKKNIFPSTEQSEVNYARSA